MTEEYYNIEKILDRRKVNGKFEYKIKWEGYPLSQSTWEPMKNLENCRHLVEEYDKCHPINVDAETPKKKENNNKKKKINEEVVKENEEDQKNKKDSDKTTENNDENSKILIYENVNSYKVDDTLKCVVTVKNQNGKLMAVVEKVGEKGEIFKTIIPTDELRKINPWILLQFYESKIKFT